MTDRITCIIHSIDWNDHLHPEEAVSFSHARFMHAEECKIETRKQGELHLRHTGTLIE